MQSLYLIWHILMKFSVSCIFSVKKLILVIKRNCPLSAVFMFPANNALFFTSANSIIIMGNLYVRLTSRGARYMHIRFQCTFYIAGDIFISKLYWNFYISVCLYLVNIEAGVRWRNERIKINRNLHTGEIMKNIFSNPCCRVQLT